jgi:hypothetical protein
MWMSFRVGGGVVRGLGLKTQKGWEVWSKSGQRPSDIPSSPDRVYRNDGWVSWADWLGNERVAWKSFTDGRAVVRGLEQQSKAGWYALSKSGQRPSDIPSLPSSVYRDDGWISWPDWLGSEGRVLTKWKSFKEGRAFVRGLELKGQRGWAEWSKSGQRPSDIPAHPETTYRDAGWVSWPDWLGSERVAWKSFTEGRALVRGLELKGAKEWKEWSKSGQRPSDIPSAPDSVYRDDGWISYPDWLGFEGRAPPGSMLPFAVGRAYARKLKLRSWKEWREWSKSGQRPSNIPAGPHNTYRDAGWISMPDWLGYGSEGGATASRSSSSSSSATTAPKKKTKKKRKRRPATSHPSDLPPPPPPSTSPSQVKVKTEPPSSKSSGCSSDRIDPEPPLRKIKKEEDA